MSLPFALIDEGRVSDAVRLLSKTEPVPECGCWLFLGAMKTGGYGDIWLDGKVIGAHRASHILFKGPVPDGLDVCHRCDVRCCINPTHLFLGTRDDNMKDCSKKGRTGRASAKLTHEQAEEIRQSPLRNFEVAALYGVSQNIVSRVRKGQFYVRKH